MKRSNMNTRPHTRSIKTALKRHNTSLVKSQSIYAKGELLYYMSIKFITQFYINLLKGTYKIQ